MTKNGMAVSASAAGTVLPSPDASTAQRRAWLRRRLAAALRGIELPLRRSFPPVTAAERGPDGTALMPNPIPSPVPGTGAAA